MVAAAHPLAVEAGLDVLKHGGSAVDAAVAVQMMLGVVEPQASGIELHRWQKITGMNNRGVDALKKKLRRSTGESNVFEWNWAPEEKMTFDF